MVGNTLVFYLAGVMFFCSSFRHQNNSWIEEYRWKNRLIIINSTNSNAQRQLGLFTDENDELKERQLIIIQIDGDSTWVDGIYRPDYSGKQLKTGLSLTDQFECVLIGKDGGTKCRSKVVKPPNFYFDRIDQMPMRKSEIQQATQN